MKSRNYKVSVVYKNLGKKEFTFDNMMEAEKFYQRVKGMGCQPALMPIKTVGYDEAVDMFWEYAKENNNNKQGENFI